MASAASAQSRGAARVSVNKYWLLVLLCLAFVPHLLAAEEILKNERKMTPADSRLKCAADSLINGDQLEQVIEHLQDAVDQANKQKAERLESIATTVKEMDTRWKALYPHLQQALMTPDSSSVHDLLKFSKQTVEKLRKYFDLKKESLTAEVEDVERKLEDNLKMPDLQDHHHTEL
ncbi:uncharacterized protein LOC144987164 [Oryzias latipes]